MKQKIIVLLLLAFMSFPQIVSAVASGSLSALDTVADFETKIEASGFPAGRNLKLVIAKPDGNSFEINGTADETGYLNAIVPDSQTRKAGTYRVGVDGRSETTTFKVFPGEMDPLTSVAYTDKTSLTANGVDFARIIVKIADEFDNSLQFHEVKLTSSRSADRIIEQNAQTDATGSASFSVSSREAGQSTLIATDESAGITLSNRIGIVFSPSSTVLGAVGGDPETVLIAQAGTGGISSAVARLEIENLAATVNMNETLNFSVRAVNSSGITVTNYSGTVTFSASPDTNAQLPSDYTFRSSDQGRKTFDLGLTFRTVGTQTLNVHQIGNALIKGDKIVTVLATRTATDGQVRITKPAPGTYSTNTREIAGEVNPNGAVKIFDNGQQIAEATANNTGRFSFMTSALSDGQHTFVIESSGVRSSPVTITIDTTRARVTDVRIDPQNVAPGGAVQISVRSDPNLASIQVTLGTLITDMTPDLVDPALYRGTLAAPSQAGDYTVNVTLTDSVGNQTPAAEIGRVHVDSGLTAQPPSSLTVPSKVQGVQAIAGNGRVSLIWSPAQAASGMASYRIYYGTGANNLNLVSSTQGALTSFDVGNLQNGTVYYFQIAGVDTQGSEGDVRSDTVNATPSANAPNNSIVLCDTGPCPPDAPTAPGQPQDGPGLIGMVIASLLSGSVLKFLKARKRKVQK